MNVQYLYAFHLFTIHITDFIILYLLSLQSAISALRALAAFFFVPYRDCLRLEWGWVGSWSHSPPCPSIPFRNMSLSDNCSSFRQWFGIILPLQLFKLFICSRSCLLFSVNWSFNNQFIPFVSCDSLSKLKLNSFLLLLVLSVIAFLFVCFLHTISN